MPVLLLLAVATVSYDVAALNAAAMARWPLSDPAIEQQLIQHRSDLSPEAHHAWALDRALPMLSGEIPVSDVVLRDVLLEVSATSADTPSELQKMQQARADYAARHLRRAADRYAAIEKESPLWPEALRERSWTLLLLDRPGDALGATVSLQAPYFAPEDHAEGRLMKATVLLSRCRFDEARSEIASLADAGTVDFSEREARSAIATGIAPQARAARAAWNAPLVVRVREALAQTMPEATRRRVQETGVRLLLAAYVDEADGIRDARERALRIRYESFRQQRELLEKHHEPSAPHPSPLPKLDDDEVEWSFDGTFWRDELGTYRYTAGDACPHEAKP